MRIPGLARRPRRGLNNYTRDSAAVFHARAFPIDSQIASERITDVPGFSPTLMDHFQSPRNRGQLDDPDLVGVAGVPGRGRFLVLYLKVDGDCVSIVRFRCHGCGVTIACGSALSELIQGQSLETCQSICDADIVRALDGVPPNRGDCPAFAISALGDALRQILGAMDQGIGDSPSGEQTDELH